MSSPPHVLNFDGVVFPDGLNHINANFADIYSRLDSAAASAIEWLANSFTPLFVDASNFTLAGDQTSLHAVGRMVRAHLTSGYVYAAISASSYDGGTELTTVTLDATVLDDTLDGVELGILTPGADGAVPSDVLRTFGDQAVAGHKDLTGATLSVAAPTADAHPARKVDLDAVETDLGSDLGDLETQVAAEHNADGTHKGGRNAIINGDFIVVQRGTSFTAATTPANDDDTYLLDRWVLLSDGNDIVDVTQETTTIPTGGRAACKLEVVTANKQFAKVQIIEAKDCAHLTGDVASLSFKARKGAANATVGTLRAAVLAWDGAEDAVTSDMVSAWAGAGTDPTWAANWTAENAPSDLALTDAYQTFTIENISIDTSGAKNLALIVWCDDTDGTVGDLVYISELQIEQGEVATAFERKAMARVFEECRRFFIDSALAGAVYNSSVAVGNMVLRWTIEFGEMRTTPTLAIANATYGNAQNLTLANRGASAMDVDFQTDGGAAQHSTTCDWTADAEL